MLKDGLVSSEELYLALYELPLPKFYVWVDSYVNEANKRIPLLSILPNNWRQTYLDNLNAN